MDYSGFDIRGFWTSNDSSIFHKNFSCPFAVANWNCWNFDSESRLRAEKCARHRYFPFPEFQRLDLTFLFGKFNGSRIFMEGDSITQQHFINFACRLQPYLKTFSLSRDGHWCNEGNICLPPNLHNTLQEGSATFGLLNTEIHLQYSQPPGVCGSRFLDILKPGDVHLFNFGLHGSADTEKCLQRYLAHAPLLISKGVHMIWRETIATQFNTTSGTYLPDLITKQQITKTAHCVDSDHLDTRLAWSESTNSRVTPLMLQHGIPVLPVWNATLNSPSSCRIGKGIDCVHFCEPGVVNYFTDLLLHYLFTAQISNVSANSTMK